MGADPQPPAADLPAGTELVASHPMLPSLDLSRTVDFYVQRLGFSRTLLNDEVAVLKRDEIELHFWICDDAAIPANSGCRIQVRGIAGLHEHCRRLGLGPGDLQGGERYRVFSLNDPDGNIIWFFALDGPPPWER
jgi:hypothetical protein